MYAYVSNNPISNTDDDGDSLFKAVKKAVKTAAKTALKEIGKVVGRALVKGTKKYVKNKIDGYYQIGKAYVDSKINELKTKSKFFYAEVGVSDPTTSIAYSKGTKTIGQYTNKTYKLQNQRMSCSTDRVLDLGLFSVSKSTTDNCFWENDVAENESINVAGSIGHFEISLEGLFVGVTGGLHYGGVGVDVKAGYYIFRWDWIF